MIMIHDGVFFKDKRLSSRECDKCNMQFSVAAMALLVNANRLTFLLH